MAANHSSHGCHCPAEYVPRVAFDVVSAVMVEGKEREDSSDNQKQNKKSE